MSSSLKPLNSSFENSNCMNQLMQWFYDKETSTILKVGACALAVISVIGTGFLLGYPILVSCLAATAAIPLSFWANYELEILEEADDARLKVQAKENKRQEFERNISIVKNILNTNGKSFDNLSVLCPNPNTPQKKNLVWEACLTHVDMEDSVMKGTNFLGANFIALKVNDLAQSVQDQQKRVLIAYLAASYDFWGIRLPGCYGNENVCDPLVKDVTENLRSIFNGNHPQFRLV